MAEIVSFRDLDAWQVGMDLVLITYQLASGLPQSERYELSAQMRRAAVSIPANVAEGQANGAGRRYLHHVRIALGSLAELETHVEIAKRLQLVSVQAATELEAHLARTGQVLGGLRRSLRRQLLKTAAIPTAGVILLLCSLAFR